MISLVGLCIAAFLGTYVINSLKRYKKQTNVHGSHTFLVKVEMILIRMWAHPKNVTRQISLDKRHVHGNHAGLGAQAVEPAGQLHNVGVELFYMLHKLTHTDALGFLEHICDEVILLLSRVVWKQGEKLEHHAVIK